MYTFPEASSWSYKDCSIMYKTTGEGKKMLINTQKNSKTFSLLCVFVYSPGEENYGTTEKNNPHERHACMHEMAVSLEAGF